MHLFHNFKETIRILDSEGRTYAIAPNRAWPVPSIEGTDCNGSQSHAPFSIPAEKVAKLLCQEGIHYGLVVIPEKRTDTGIQFDMKEAERLSRQVRKHSEDGVLERYVKGAKEDELAKMPVKPPSESIQRILDSRGLDLKRDFGLSPVGYRVSEAAAARDAELETLRKENADFKKEMGEMKDMLGMLLEDKKAQKAREKERV